MLWTGQFREHWEARFQALDSLLEEMQTSERDPAQPASPPADTPSSPRPSTPRGVPRRPASPKSRGNTP
jgi:hypothetical protein